MRTATLALAALSFATPTFAGNVRVVGSGPGQIPVLQDAVTLSDDGDVVLVKSGTYGSIRATGKTVSIVADTGANVQITGAIRVINLDAADSIVLSGLKATAVVSPGLPELYAGLYVKTALGQVVAQDCTFTSDTTTGVAGGGAIVASDCVGLSIVRCGAIGSTLGHSNDTPGIMISAGARVSLDQVDAFGARGRHAPPTYTHIPDGCHGEPGLRYVALATGAQSLVFASDSLFVGGNGGNASIESAIGTFCGFGGPGGDGVFGRNANGLLFVLAVTAAGGAGGLKDPNCPFGAVIPGGDGPPGNPYFTGLYVNCNTTPINYGPTTYTTLAGTARVVSGSTLVRDNDSVRLDFTGVPGERVEIVLTSKKPTFVNQPSQSGVLHVPVNTWRRIGTVQPTGQMRFGFAVPDLPLSNPSTTYFVQARFIDPTTSQVRLSNLHTIVAVDASF